MFTINRNAMIHNKKAYVILICASIAAAVFSFLFFAESTHALTISPPKIEAAADPGRVYSGEMRLRNTEREPVRYISSVQNFEASGESGTPNFVEDDTGLASWISVQDSMIVGPGEIARVPFAITIPEDASPGGYHAALFWERDLGNEQTQGFQLQARLGMLILFTVNGEVIIGGELLDFDTVDQDHTHAALPVEFEYRYQNTGNSLIQPSAQATVYSMFGKEIAVIDANLAEGSILRESTRKFSFMWGEVVQEEPKGFWRKRAYQKANKAFGRYTVELELDFEEEELESESAEVSLWILPFELLVVRALGAIAIIMLFLLLMRAYRRSVIRSFERRQK